MMALALLPLGAALWLGLGEQQWWPLAALLTMSLLTVAAYAWDKRQAVRGEWRIPESRLHLLELCGGWPRPPGGCEKTEQISSAFSPFMTTILISTRSRDMTMWTGIVLIVFISLLFGYLGKRARYQMGDARITDRLGKQDLVIRELQERIANLEAIVIEEEKRRPFREL